MEQARHEVIKIDSDVHMRYAYQYDRGCYVPKHWHNSMEVIYVIDGEMIIGLPDVTYKVKANEFLIIDPKTVHSVCTLNENHNLLLQIPFEFLVQYIPTIESIRFQGLYSGNPMVSKEGVECLRSLFEKMAKIRKEKEDNNVLQFYSLLFEMLHCLMTYFKTEMTAGELRATEKYIERLSLITEYVENHFKDPISYIDGANALNLNPEYFSRFFKRYMGMTFLEYVNSIRVIHIYQDLVNTDLPIQELTERYGFTNYKLFLFVIYFYVQFSHYLVVQ